MLIKNKKGTGTVVMKDVDKKREKEQIVVEQMIKLYCKKNHKDEHKENGLCKECSELAEYAKQRSAKCPFMENKTFCNNCRVHCYKPAMREKIKQVMRFSGPRMILYHPIMAVWHVVRSIKEKKKIEKENN